MKKMMSVMGTGLLMMGAGYGVYSYVTNNKNMIMKKMSKAKVCSPYTSCENKNNK